MLCKNYKKNYIIFSLNKSLKARKKRRINLLMD